MNEIELSTCLESISPDITRASRILITGGTGMIGSWITTLLSRLIDKNSLNIAGQITLLSHSGNLENIRPILSKKHLKIMSYIEFSNLKKIDFDLVIHAASPASPNKYLDSDSIFLINSKFLEEIYSRCDIAPNLIYLSSGEVYGSDYSDKISEDFEGSFNYNLSRSMYPLAKIAAETTIKKLNLNYDFKYNIFRLFHSFGPGMRRNDGRSFADFIWRVVDGKKPLLHSPGQQVRGFLYLCDTVTGILGTSFVNQPLNLGSDSPMTVLDFARLVSRVGGFEGEVEFLQNEVGHELSPVNFAVPDLSKIRKLGFMQRVPLEVGIERTLNWAKENNKY
jgi:nucleoside-diphosphate-sugar epimerase